MGAYTPGRRCSRLWLLPRSACCLHTSHPPSLPRAAHLPLSPRSLPPSPHGVPIFSLPQQWLWCETWCGTQTRAEVRVGAAGGRAGDAGGGGGQGRWRAFVCVWVGAWVGGPKSGSTCPVPSMNIVLLAHYETDFPFLAAVVPKSRPSTCAATRVHRANSLPPPSLLTAAVPDRPRPSTCATIL